MNNAPSRPNISVETLVGMIADEFIERQNRGEQPQIEEFTRRYPEHADAIREGLLALLMIRPPVDSVAKTPPPAEPPPLGTLGDFRLIQEIGRGAMGVVYEAEQISLGRHVALKVLPLAATLDPNRLQRFKNEAQAAAQLHHTNIVPVYAVGCERGVHFYAMQLIEGQTVAAMIHELRKLHANPQANGLTSGSRVDLIAPTREPTPPPQEGPSDEPTAPYAPPSAPPKPAGDTMVQPAAPTAKQSITSQTYGRTVARLGLQAAEGLEHAHQLGVVHRDIKPANLLVDTRGNLWVTDFGLAQCQGHIGLTMTGDVVGTLRYMSPEQAQAKRGVVDHRTDLYALGATLYELATLAPVFGGHDRGELLRQITFDEPQLLRSRNAALPADLETIIHKALDKDVERRYTTAQEMADDLRRFLEDKPIQAKPPTLPERAYKWARRHKTIVRAAMVLLVLTLAGSILSTLLIAAAYQKEAVQRALAQKNEKDAQDAREAAEEDRRRAEKGEADAIRERQRAKATLAKTLAAADRMYTRFSTDPNLLLNQPHMELVRLEFSREALRLCEELLAENSTDPEAQRETARAYHLLGSVQQMLGKQEEARNAFGRAVELWKKLHEDSPPDPVCRFQLARSANHLALVLYIPGMEPVRAERLFDQALSLLQALVAEFPGETAYHKDLALALYSRALLLDRHGRTRMPDGWKTFRGLVETLDELAKTFPLTPDFRYRLAQSHNLAGRLLAFRRPGEYEEAEKHHRKALMLYQGLRAEHPRLPEYRQGLVEGYYQLGQFLRARDRFGEAEEALREAVGWQDRLTRDFFNVPDYHDRLAKMLDDLAHLLMKRHSWCTLACAYQTGLSAAVVHFALREDLAEANLLCKRALDHGQAALDRSPNHKEYRALCHRYHQSLIETLVRLGKHTEASQEAALIAENLDSWKSLYDAACYAARCVVLARIDPQLSAEKRAQVVESYHRQAFELLSQAVMRVDKDVEQLAVQLKSDRHLAPLRSLDEFKQLQKQLDGKRSKPPATRSVPGTLFPSARERLRTGA